MKNHIRIISLIFVAVLVVPYFSIALTPASYSMDATEQIDIESVMDIPETTVPIETNEPVDIRVPQMQIPVVPEEQEVLYEVIEVIKKPEKLSKVNLYELEMLACVIYQEAGGDRHCDECRRMVADVVLNRVADPRFPNTIFDVLTEPGQYGLNPRTGVVWPERADDIYEQHAVERAYRIAKEVLSGKHSALYGEGYIWQATFVQGKDNVYCCGHYYGR